MSGLKVKLNKRSYSIEIGRGTLAKAGRYLAGMDIGRHCVIITNSRISRLYGRVLKKSLIREGIEILTITVPDSESSKSYKIFSRVINRIAEWDKGKKPFIAAFGGGVIGDLAGFVAAAYRRGVPLVQIPTTLVAQVDSSIGGKVAIDLALAKNLVGAFYQPKIVISDISLLKTLPEREIRCGMAEIIKYSVINSKTFFSFLSRNMALIKRLDEKSLEYTIKKCCSIKSGVVSADERDTKGARAVLNYGHTIGHAVETAAGYTGKYNHGEAIAIGMVIAANISAKMGMLPLKEFMEIENLIARSGLPTRIKGLKSAAILRALRHDKKFAYGINRFVLPVRIGKVKVVKNVPEKLIADSLKEVSER